MGHWVTEVRHLGNTLEANNSLRKNCAIKRVKFIAKVNYLQQDFHFVSLDLIEYCESLCYKFLWQLPMGYA